MPGTRVELCSGPEGLRQLRDPWLALQGSLAHCPFYVRHEWYEALVGALLDEPAQVRFATLWREDRCRGIVPLVPERRFPRLCINGMYSLPYCDHVDLTDVLLADGESLGQWLPKLWGAFTRQRLRWSALRVPSVPASGLALRGLRVDASGIVYRAPRHSGLIDCRVAYEQARERYSTRLQKTLKRAARGLGQIGPVELRTVRAGEGLDAALEEFLRIEASGWKGEAGTCSAIQYFDGARRFYEALYRDSAIGGPAEINLLAVGGRIVAGQLCMRSGGALSLIKIAYDQELQKWSPGTVLLDLVVQRGCATPGCEVVNLVTGTAWMDEWGVSRVAVGDLWVFHRPWVGALFASSARIYSALKASRSRLHPVPAGRG